MAALRPVHLQRVRSLLDQVRQCQRRLAQFGESEPATLARSYAPFLITAEGVRVAPPIRDGASGWDDEATSPGVPIAPPEVGFRGREFRPATAGRRGVRAQSGQAWERDEDALDSGVYHRPRRAGTSPGNSGGRDATDFGPRRSSNPSPGPLRLRGLPVDNDDDDARTGNYPSFGGAFRRPARSAAPPPTEATRRGPRASVSEVPAVAAAGGQVSAYQEEGDDEQTYVHSLAELRALLGGGS